MSDYMERVPPHNIEAEQALLGACLLDRMAAINSLEFLHAQDFYREDHRYIYECISKLINEGAPCDLVTVVDSLTETGNLERAGGIPYLASLSNAVPSASSAVYYAKIVAEKALIRSLIAAAGRIEQEGYSGQSQAQELMEMAEKAIFEVSEKKTHQGFIPIGEVAVDVLEQIGKIKANAGVTGVPTFRDLDVLLSGLQKSDMIILAARPGVGKTSMALNIAQNAAIRHGRTVAIFSLEMPKEQLVQRMLCSLARVDQGKVRSGMASANDLANLSRELNSLAKAEIYLDDTAGITVMEMRSKCRKLKIEKKKLDLIVVDYLQLMQGGSRRAENRQQEIAEISRSLKALAKEMDAPVLALSQLSRLADRTNEPPSLSFLRESGSLEQDADLVIFLHQDKSAEEEENGIYEVIVAKHRNGPVGKVKMVFIPAYTSFENYAKEWIGEPPPLAE